MNFVAELYGLHGLVPDIQAISRKPIPEDKDHKGECGAAPNDGELGELVCPLREYLCHATALRKPFDITRKRTFIFALSTSFGDSYDAE